MNFFLFQLLIHSIHREVWIFNLSREKKTSRPKFCVLVLFVCECIQQTQYFSFHLKKILLCTHNLNLLCTTQFQDSFHLRYGCFTFLISPIFFDIITTITVSIHIYSFVHSYFGDVFALSRFKMAIRYHIKTRTVPFQSVWVCQNVCFVHDSIPYTCCVLYMLGWMDWLLLSFFFFHFTLLLCMSQSNELKYQTENWGRKINICEHI